MIFQFGSGDTLLFSQIAVWWWFTLVLSVKKSPTQQIHDQKLHSTLWFGGFRGCLAPPLGSENTTSSLATDDIASPRTHRVFWHGLQRRLSRLARHPRNEGHHHQKHRQSTLHCIGVFCGLLAWERLSHTIDVCPISKGRCQLPTHRELQWEKTLNIGGFHIPIGSKYWIFTYIWLVFMVNM